MLNNRDSNLRVVLFGLPRDIAENLGQMVSKWGSILYIPPLFPILRSLGLIPGATLDRIFVWTGENPGMSLLELVRSAAPQVPAVAVNFHAENREILDALDSGAVDYCTPPFDTTHIQCLLQAANKAACC